MTLKALQQKYKNKRKYKPRTKNIIQSKSIHNLQKLLLYCSRQYSISQHPNLGIHYPPRSSSSKPLSQNLYATSVEYRNRITILLYR
jgi:hypothetical protein